ncbi:MAG: YceI family protein, partial [Candidatus Paceibacterota bacterium]
MMKRSIKQTSIFLILALFTLISDRLPAQSFMADDGYVEFVSTAPLLEFKGVSENLTGLIDLESMMVDFYVDLNTLETGVRRRDRDMRNSYLETDKFPFAEFSGQLVSEFDPNLTETQEARAAGKFKIHGVER